MAMEPSGRVNYGCLKHPHPPTYRSLLPTAAVEPIELLDALLEIIETGLGFRDEAPELGSDELNCRLLDPMLD